MLCGSHRSALSQMSGSSTHKQVPFEIISPGPSTASGPRLCLPSGSPLLFSTMESYGLRQDHPRAVSHAVLGFLIVTVTSEAAGAPMTPVSGTHNPHACRSDCGPQILQCLDHQLQISPLCPELCLGKVFPPNTVSCFHKAPCTQTMAIGSSHICLLTLRQGFPWCHSGLRLIM